MDEIIIHHHACSIGRKSQGLNLDGCRLPTCGIRMRVRFGLGRGFIVGIGVALLVILASKNVALGIVLGVISGLILTLIWESRMKG